MISIFQAQNTQCDNSVGFSKLGHKCKHYRENASEGKYGKHLSQCSHTFMVVVTYILYCIEQLRVFVLHLLGPTHNMTQALVFLQVPIV